MAVSSWLLLLLQSGNQSQLFHLCRELLIDINSWKSEKFFRWGQVSAEQCSRKCHCIEIHTIGLFCSFTSQDKTTQKTTRHKTVSNADSYAHCWSMNDAPLGGVTKGSTLSFIVYLPRIVMKQILVTQPVPVPALPSWQDKVRPTVSRKVIWT